MRIRRLVTLTLLALTGCGANDATPQSETFDLEGAWVYLGPSDAPHMLTVGGGSMVYADVEGQWSSTWTIKAFDNEAHHFQVVFASASGMYLPVGESMSGAYDLSGTLLTTQLAKDLTSYPPLQSPGTCTGGADGAAVPDCRVYTKKN